MDAVLDSPITSDTRRRLRGPLVFQAFRPRRDFFSGLGVILANYHGEDGGQLMFRLYALDSEAPPRDSTPPAPSGLRLLAEKMVPAKILDGDEQYDFYFHSIPASRDRPYVLSITSHRTSSNGGMTPWLSEGAEPHPEMLWLWHRGQVSTQAHLDLRLLYSPPTAPGSVPEAVLLSPISQCNLNCTHCISRETRRKLDFLPEDLKEDIARLTRSGQIKRVCADYSGDAFFLDQKYGGVLDYLFGLEADLYLDTHGNHMSVPLAERLLKSRLRRINFSIDAGTAATHAAIRRGSRPFSEVLENIKLFCRVREELAAGHVGVTISVTLMKQNLDEIPLCVDFGVEAGVDELMTRHLEVYTDDMEQQSLYWHQDEYDRKWPILMEYARAMGLRMLLPRPFGPAAERSGHHYCPVAWESASILANGDVMACCVPTTKMGNLHRQSLGEIWRSEPYREFRRRVNSDDPPEVCRSCPIFRLAKNPTSYFFNRVRRQLRPLGESLAAAAAAVTSR